MSDPPTPERFVADADVLAADLLLGGSAREAVDLARSHSWVTLVATDPLLDGLAETVDQPAGDHPGLAAASHGEATQLLSFDEGLGSAKTGATLRKYLDVSVRTPAAFVRLFDPESIYEVAVGGEYPGPDRDPRA